VFPGRDVVDLAAFGGAVAAGEAAGAVAGEDVVVQGGRWPVGGAAVVDQVPELVGDQAAPGAGLIVCEGSGEFGGDRLTVQLTGLIVEVEQGGQGDGDVDGWSDNARRQVAV